MGAVEVGAVEAGGSQAAGSQSGVRGDDAAVPGNDPALSPDVEWLVGLSPWPEDGFGLGRMKALLSALGDPQERYPSVHVVGTNGKSTATVTIEQLLLAQGLVVGSTISPHVRAWEERIRVGGRPVDLPTALRRVRSAADRLRATQFESITAAALLAFADAHVDVAVVEAGLGGRHDATNVLRSEVVLLTGVGLEHTDVLGDTVEAIAAEKLAVVHYDDTVVILPDDTFAPLVRRGRIEYGGAREAAAAFVGHEIADVVEVALPGRLESRPGEIRDGAHNPDGVEWLRARLEVADYTVCASILADKDVDAMLRGLATIGDRFVATRSSNARALTEGALAELAAPYFRIVEACADPVAALRRAHELGEPVLVTGSLYLLADLEAERGRR